MQRFSHRAIAAFVVLWLSLLASPAVVRAQAVAEATLPEAKAGLLHTVTVTETVDLERGHWPIVIDVAADAAASLTVVRVDETGEAPVAFQVMTVREPDVLDPADVGAVDETVEVVFFTDLSPDEFQTFRVYRGDAAAAHPDVTLSVTRTGEPTSFGAAVDTGPVTFAIDPQSGQLLTYDPKWDKADEVRFFRQGGFRPFHWNPDIWVRGMSWGHTSDWRADDPERRPMHAESSGPLAFRTVRWGPMVWSNDTDTVVSYTMFAGMPFVMEASRMRFTKDTVVNAVRNNELVFSRGMHTHAVYPDEQSEAQAVRLYEPEDHRKVHGRVVEAAPDIPWIGLFSDREGYGIASVNLVYENAAPDGSAGTHDADALFYALDYGEHRDPNFHYNFAYITRAIFYDRGNPVTVPAGATYAERSAFVVFPAEGEDEARFDAVERWSHLLHNPPRVSVE